MHFLHCANNIDRLLYVDIFDGGMVVTAFFLLNIFHPGRLMYSKPAVVENMVEKKMPRQDESKRV